MRKFRIDVLAYLLVAIVLGGLVWFRGEAFWLDTEGKKALAIVALCTGLVLLTVLLGFEGSYDEAAATQRLMKQLGEAPAPLSGTTQAALMRGSQSPEVQVAPKLARLRSRLRYEDGCRWRYRRSWLLLTGDAGAVSGLLPGLVEDGWLITVDTVLLWCQITEDGALDVNWLKAIRKLRRQRPVDAVVLATDGDVPLPARAGGAPPHGMRLRHIAGLLRWSAPIFVLEVSRTASMPGASVPVIACELSPRGDGRAVENALLALRDELARRSVPQLIANSQDRTEGEISQRLDTRSKALAEWLAGLAYGRGEPLPMRGIAFVPCPRTAAKFADAGAGLAVWQYMNEAARRYPGTRVGAHPATVATAITLAAVGLWTAGVLVSGLRNHADLQAASQSLGDLRSATNTAASLRALLAVQQQIERYEHRQERGAPLATRFGLNRDPAVLAALWRPYTEASQRLLLAPTRQNIEATLADLSRLPATALDDATSRWALGGHAALKSYLMLADPVRAEPGFLAPELARHWATDARLTPGELQDLGERLFQFYASHLQTNPEWRIEPRHELVNGARQTLLAAIGQRNAQDAIYQSVLAGIGGKYPDQTLATLTAGTDTRGLLHTSAVVPGAFTRQAWEGHVAEAIEQAARRRAVVTDWVLTAGQPQPAEKVDHEDLRAALTAQYFADYAAHWQQFMNGLQWAPAATLPESIAQLRLMADARQSPVIALTKSLAWQGGAGARRVALADTLVARAQDLLGKKAALEMDTADPAGPLGPAFGPVLRLIGQPGRDGKPTQATVGDLSLQRFLDRATALRLRLQQITQSADADAQVRQLAQALFQGKGSELADTQAYAHLMAASLGSEWAGMGDALFVRPIAQSTQTVLQPAQASLNAAWREDIAMTWGRAFAGRYPFADTANDASLPELARFLGPRDGLIGTFLTTQLAGVLELRGDQWVPAAGQALAFDPAFLQAINRLQRLGTRLMAQGEPRYRFEMKPVPTPGLTETVLNIDGQTLRYYNQRETWQAMRWPAVETQATAQEPGTRLQWQTEQAGTNKHYEFGGRWGLMRMLERAHVEPIDSATFQLTWQGVPEASEDSPARGNTDNAGDEDPESLTPRTARMPASSTLTHPIRYQLRTELGHGPLDLLTLRGFVLPSRIFADKAAIAAGLTDKHQLGRKHPDTR